MGDEPSSASRFVECLRSKPRAQADHGINRRPGCRPPLDGAARYSDNRSHRPPASQVAVGALAKSAAGSSVALSSTGSTGC